MTNLNQNAVTINDTKSENIFSRFFKSLANLILIAVSAISAVIMILFIGALHVICTVFGLIVAIVSYTFTAFFAIILSVFVFCHSLITGKN